MNEDQVKISSGGRTVETTVETMQKATRLLSGDERIKEIAEEILGIQGDQ